MDAIQGAVLKVKMDYIEAWTEARRAIAGEYDRLLRSSCRRPAPPATDRHVYHVYAVAVSERDALRQSLSDRGIETGIHYPVPVHLQAAYRDLGYRAGDLPVAEALAKQFLSLPIYPELQPSQVEEIARALEEASRWPS
jgi:dTDP-4-amino-4,6-dideoxygalactose transaminase